MNIKSIIIIAIISLTCFSCIDYNDIAIKEAGSVEIKSMGIKNILADATLVIDNHSSRNIKVKELEVVVHNNYKEVMRVILKEPIKIAKKDSNQHICSTFQLQTSGTLLQLASFALKSNSNITVDVNAKIKSGMFSKKFEFTSLPLKDVEKIIGINPLTLIK